MGELKFEKPHNPFHADIPGGLGIGRHVKLCGKVKHKDDPRFCVNFGVGPAFNQNIALHISPRHNEKCVVVSHMINGMWGAEQRFKNPIHFHDFELKVDVEHDYYKIHIDGHHVASIPFTFPPHIVNHIEILGGVKIKHVHVKGHSHGAIVSPPPMYMPATAPVMGGVPTSIVVVEPNYYHHHHHGHHHHHC